ncbi:MAG: PAS domain S-box protein [Methanobacterium sp.]|nr:PAS domain S-box protein [Methanobacterium sp.]
MNSKILIVEDESIEAMSFEKSLKSSGYQVVGVASTGEDALKKVADLRPDLVLMDIVLKGDMDGIKAAALIKDDFDIPVIYLTSHPEKSTLKRAKLTSPYGYLIKPVNKTELNNIIELALYKHDMESKLKISEDKYRSIVENVLDAYFRGDKEGRIIMASPSAALMYGFDSPQEMIGLTAVSMYKSAEDRQKMLAQLKKYGKVENMEVESVKVDGSSFWISMNVQYIYDDEGGIQGTEAFVRDITETKKIEKELKKRETYYRTIFEHTGTATVIIEGDKTISLANAQFEKISGYSREELEGKKRWTDFVMEDDLEDMKKYHSLRRVDPTAAPTSYDFRFIDKMGNIKNIHLDVDIIPGTKKSVASLLDITELKKSQEVAVQNEKKFRGVLDNMMEGCQIISPNWRYLYVNDAVAKQGHAQKEELLGHTMMEIYSGIENTELFDVLRSCMKERSSHHIDNEFVYPDGSVGWYELSIHPVPEGIFILSIDITERVKMQEELQFKNMLLEAQLESTIDGILVVDENGKPILYNQRFNEMWNISTTILESKDDKKLIKFITDQLKYPLYVAKTIEHLNANKDQKSSDEIEFKDGKVFESYSSPICANDNYHGRIWYFRDITELKKSQEALIKSEKKYRELVDNSIVGVLITKINGDIQFANEAMVHMVKSKSIEKFKAENIIKYYKNPADRDELVQLLKKDGNVNQYETELVSTDNEIINVIISAHLSNNNISSIIIDRIKNAI